MRSTLATFLGSAIFVNFGKKYIIQLKGKHDKVTRGFSDHSGLFKLESFCSRGDKHSKTPAERKLPKALEAQQKIVWDQRKQLTAQPTFRWIMQKFQRIHWVN